MEIVTKLPALEPFVFTEKKQDKTRIKTMCLVQTSHKTGEGGQGEGEGEGEGRGQAHWWCAFENIRKKETNRRKDKDRH